MKRPEKQIVERKVWHRAELGDLARPIVINLSGIINDVETSGFDPNSLRLEINEDYYDQDYLEIVSDNFIENPNFNREMEAWEAHQARQKAEKLAYKEKAKEELMARLAKVEREIEELK